MILYWLWMNIFNTPTIRNSKDNTNIQLNLNQLKILIILWLLLDWEDSSVIRWVQVSQLPQMININQGNQDNSLNQALHKMMTWTKNKWISIEKATILDKDPLLLEQILNGNHHMLSKEKEKEALRTTIINTDNNIWGATKVMRTGDQTRVTHLIIESRQMVEIEDHLLEKDLQTTTKLILLKAMTRKWIWQTTVLQRVLDNHSNLNLAYMNNIDNKENKESTKSIRESSKSIKETTKWQTHHKHWEIESLQLIELKSNLTNSMIEILTSWNSKLLNFKEEKKHLK